MSFSVFQTLLNLVLIASMVAIWIRLLKPAKDDPRLSRGLQLLQSKISVLEDLSDQVERQAQQVTQLLDQKSKDLESVISQADDKVRKIDRGSSDVASEMSSHQTEAPKDPEELASTLKFIRAAQRAHQGAQVQDLISEFEISRAEAELLIKVNRNNLQFSAEHLPSWAKGEPPPLHAMKDHWVEAPLARTAARPATANMSGSADISGSANYRGPVPMTVRPVSSKEVQLKSEEPQVAPASAPAPAPEMTRTPSGKIVRKVIFPKIDTRTTSNFP